MRHLFILISHLYIHELPTKYPREKVLDPRNTYKKKLPTKYPPEKILDQILDPRNFDERKFD